MPLDNKDPPTMNQNRQKVFYIIQQAVCHHYGLQLWELTSRSRQEPIPEARKMAWSIMRDTVDHRELTLELIAELSGGFTHATVSRGLLFFNAWCQHNTELRNAREKIQNSVIKVISCSPEIDPGWLQMKIKNTQHATT